MIGAVVECLVRVDPAAGARMIRDADAVYDAITTASEERVLKLDYWAALHYVLTAEFPMPRHVALARGLEWDDFSLENVLMGGDPTPYKDVLSVARYVPPRTVATLASMLSALTLDEISSCIDDEARDMLPARWRELADTDRELGAQFVLLVEHYRTAAAAGDGLVLYVA